MMQRQTSPQRKNSNHSHYSPPPLSPCPRQRIQVRAPSTPSHLNASFKQLAEQMWEKHQTQGVQSKMINPIKALVSKSKKRFQWDGHDLDLAYITDNIIAMGFPSEQLEAIYRNSLEDVQKFLDERHPHHYRVYNLCSERHYSHEHFEGRVAEYPFEDHQAPPFPLIFQFCQDVNSWLLKHQDNVVAIHCKAGKGRTGLMICCYLLFSGLYDKAQEVLEYYAAMRTFNCKGVTIPSQIRYVRYFEEALKIGLNPLEYLRDLKQIQLKELYCHTVPNFNIVGGCTPWLQIECQDKTYKSKYHHELQSYKSDDLGFQIPLSGCFLIKGDFRVTLLTKNMLGKSQHVFHFWLNTAFLTTNEVKLTAYQLDVVKSSDSRFSSHLQIRMKYIWV